MVSLLDKLCTINHDIYVAWKGYLKEETKTLKGIRNIWNTLKIFQSSSIVGQRLNDCRNNHLNSGKRTEISITFYIDVIEMVTREQSHSIIVWLTHPNKFRQNTIFNYVMFSCVKSSDFIAEEFLLDYDHLSVFYEEPVFSFSPLCCPVDERRFGWISLQVKPFFYILLSHSSGKTGNDNYYSKHDFEKSRKHSYILRNTTGLNGLNTKMLRTRNRHLLRRKEKWQTAARNEVSVSRLHV